MWSKFIDKLDVPEVLMPKVYDMKIEFFGSSIIKRRKNTMIVDSSGDVPNVNKKLTFVDLILDQFNADSLNGMVAQISEERILYNLKKTSVIDIAIIFHSTPDFIYFPNFTRDYNFMNQHERSIFPSLIKVHDYKLNKKDVVSHFYAKVETLENQKSYMDDMMDVTHNIDVNNNRYQGALNLINDYVCAKKIPTIHIVPDYHSIPKWFEFKSGIVDKNIWKIDKDHKSSFNKTVNAIDNDGNLKIYNLLVKYINLILNYKEYFESNSKVF